MTKAIIISAADSKYAPLANELFASIRALKYRLDGSLDLGLLDVGLDDNERRYFAAHGIQVVKCGTDINFPMRAQWETRLPGIRTLTARPFLPRYFPGYDVYMWMDADVWVQTPEAIETMIPAAAKTQALCICCEFDRCYTTFFTSLDMWGIFHGWYAANYDPETVNAMRIKPMLNAGVFAMPKASPIWEAWAKIYADVLQKTSELTEKTFMADQLGLNILLYLRGMPYVVMPSSYNWLTCYALPKIDRAAGLYVEPLPPHRLISQFHLTGENKTWPRKLEYLDGEIVERSMVYSYRGK